MSRLFITGDKHGSIELKYLSNKNFPQAKELTKDDVVLICGDTGCIWDTSKETKYWDDWAEDRPFTIATIFGNHENYDAIRAIPTEEWNGAKVHKVRPHIMYIENGEIFTFNNKTFFCMGGASSIDKWRRTEGKSWWASEIPSKEEMEHAVKNLEKYNNKVNYIITHTAPNFILDKFYYEHDDVTNFLSHYVQTTVQFDEWYCGHFHVNRNYDNFHMLYHDIKEIYIN